MEANVQVLAQVMTIIVVTVGALTTIGLGARMLWRAGSRSAPKAARALDESRIERIENAVDAIAIEVERISEAQRFTVGLLSDRLPARPAERVNELASPSSSKRVNTPH